LLGHLIPAVRARRAVRGEAVERQRGIRSTTRHLIMVPTLGPPSYTPGSVTCLQNPL
jgi:hypothetical protein